MDAVGIMLPGGYPCGDSWCRSAQLRPLVGRDEAFLADAGRTLTPAERTTALLSRCVEHATPVEFVRSLIVGDREALLLHLRRLTLGERIACVLRCPNPACEQKMDLDLRIGDLLLPPYPHDSAVHAIDARGAEGRYQALFRLPTGADQEAAAQAAARDPEAAADLLLTRCVERVTLDGDGTCPPGDLPQPVREAIADAMADRDPQAEIRLNLTCPECGVEFTSLLDAGEYLFQELAAPGGGIYPEVHLLALHYHWSEAEIMGMPRGKRSIYLGLLMDALGAGSEA